MADFFEVDFLTVGASSSGDAITLRYERNGYTFLHVVDGGLEDTGAKILYHLRRYYGGTTLSHVVVTHPDGDHAGGLKTVLKECSFYTGLLGRYDLMKSAVVGGRNVPKPGSAIWILVKYQIISSSRAFSKRLQLLLKPLRPRLREPRQKRAKSLSRFRRLKKVDTSIAVGPEPRLSR